MNIRVGSYNIFHGENKPLFLAEGTRVIDLAATAQTIAALGVDLCGLNEVRNQSMTPGLCNQAEEIAKHLGWHYAFAKAINITGGEYGNALVSRYPIRRFSAVPVVTSPEERAVETDQTHFEDRVLLIADIQVEDRILTVMICHFGLRKPEVKKAIQVISSQLKEIHTPVVLMGDFNITPDTAFYDSLAALLTDTMSRDPRENLTFSHQDPKIKIDYIFAGNGVQAKDAQVHPIGISDHRPVTADIIF